MKNLKGIKREAVDQDHHIKPQMWIKPFWSEADFPIRRLEKKYVE
jgi:hypothetical protein